MISSFLTATLTEDGVTLKYDFGLVATNIRKMTDEELVDMGGSMGKAYTKLLMQARDGQLTPPTEPLPDPIPPTDPTPNTTPAEVTE